MGDNETVTLKGRYAVAPNPCITEPCLPGMAYAVEAGGKLYFLTSGGRWSNQPRSFGGWTPAPGDSVTVVGRTASRTDIRGAEFLTIEAEALKPD